MNIVIDFSNLLVPGGCLAVCDVVDQSFFTCGKFKFHQFSSTTEELQNAYEESGFILDQWKSYKYDVMYTYDDASSVYSVVARKPLIN